MRRPWLMTERCHLLEAFKWPLPRIGARGAEHHIIHTSCSVHTILIGYVIVIIAIVGTIAPS
eukprot:COSAG06_NODE_3996_length_4677_cov_1.649410_7_plen_62_part_00